MTLACSLVAMTLAGLGTPVKSMETTIQDDAILLNRPANVVNATARQIASLGADRIRLNAGWSGTAPAPFSRRKPRAPFNPRDSRTYPAEGWRRMDHAVEAAAAAGLKVQLDIGFWAPKWAVRRVVRPYARQRWSPDPQEYADFAEALARRYDGNFRDPEHSSRRLPAVRMF